MNKDNFMAGQINCYLKHFPLGKKIKISSETSEIISFTGNLFAY